MSRLGMIFVQGKDRPGIISAVTGALYQAKLNLEDVSMTLLEGQFAMMLSFKLEKINEKKLLQKMEVLRKKPWSLFVNFVAAERNRKAKKNATRSALITAIGKDRTGIVHGLSSDLAAIQANVTNLDCRLLHRRSGTDFYSLALEVDLKSPRDIAKIKKMTARWQSRLGIEVKVHSSEAAVF